MAQFSGLPLAILRSISAASGDTYQDVDEPELRAELADRGFDPGRRELVNVMRALKDAGYLDCTFTGSEIALIRLGHAGRQEVEGWPTTPGSFSSSDVDELLLVLHERSEDPTLPTEERGKARAAAASLKDLGTSVTATLIAGWLQHLGIR